MRRRRPSNGNEALSERVADAADDVSVASHDYRHARKGKLGHARVGGGPVPLLFNSSDLEQQNRLETGLPDLRHRFPDFNYSRLRDDDDVLFAELIPYR